MKIIKPDIAIFAAEQYVTNKYKPLDSISGFSDYFVIVGYENNSIFAEDLPINQLYIKNNSDATKVFIEKCNYNEKFLLNVIVDKEKKKLKTTILRNPN